jgi:hypothetical protein
VKVTIDKGVPLPVERKAKGYWIELAAAMEVGDSVLVPDATALAGALRRRGAGVAQRQEGTGVRVWRTT